MVDANLQPLQFADYTLLKRIAVGGMAEIYRAEIHGVGGFRREVAIKKVLPDQGDDNDSASMLLDEARIAAGLMHPCIVQVLNCGIHEGVYYIVMEYVSGKSLRRLMTRLAQRGSRLTWNEALGVGVCILQGLACAHSKVDDAGVPMDIVHRDVTPENVLLSYEGAVKLADFGIARATGRITKTETGMVRGKLTYMAPEQLRGTAIDHRVDQYAAALVIAEMFLGHTVFDGPTEAAVFAAVMEGALPRLQAMADAEAALGRAYPAIQRALSTSRDDRFTCTQDFADALSALVESGELATTPTALAKHMRDMFGPDQIQEEEEIQRLRSQVRMASAPNVPLPAPRRHQGFAGQGENPTLIIDAGVDGIKTSGTKMSADVKPEPTPEPKGRTLPASYRLLGALAILTTVAVGAWGAQDFFSRPAPPDPTVAVVPAPTAPPVAPPVKPLAENAASAPAKAVVPLPRPRVAPRVPVAAPLPAPGILDVACLPWCEIRINGRLVGNSPLRQHEIPSGKYDVEAFNPPTGLRETKHLAVTAGQNVHLRFRLQNE